MLMNKSHTQMPFKGEISVCGDQQLDWFAQHWVCNMLVAVKKHHCISSLKPAHYTLYQGPQEQRHEMLSDIFSLKEHTHESWIKPTLGHNGAMNTCPG